MLFKQYALSGNHLCDKLNNICIEMIFSEHGDIVLAF